MPADRHDTIPGFTCIAPSIWEWTPTLDSDLKTQDFESSAPSLIIILSWTGAQGKHVAKYADTYKTLYASTPILIITTSAKDLCFRSSERKQERLGPAVNRIRTYGNVDNILIHAFSEGGSNKAVELAEAYRNSTGVRLPCSALCLDSTPGLPRFRRLCNALSLSLPPNPIFRCTGLLLGGVVLGGIWIVYTGFKGYDNNVVSQTRRRLYDQRFWHLDAPRAYLYSTSDALIASEDVQEHAKEAIAKNIPVVDACFHKSAHCRHAAEDADKYWDAVVTAWNLALVKEDRLDEKDLKLVTSDASPERTLW